MLSHSCGSLTEWGNGLSECHCLDPTGLAANTDIEVTTIEALYASVRQQTARLAAPEGLGVGAPGGNAVPDVKVEYTSPPW